MIDFFMASAMAQEATQATNPQQNPVMSFLPFIVIFFIFYFLMIKPQKKKLQEEQAMLSALNKGDEIFTKSGLIGTITGLTEKIVTLEIDTNVKLKILRSHIAGKSEALFAKKDAAKK